MLYNIPSKNDMDREIRDAHISRYIRSSSSCRLGK